jgi:tetratricopeptide (TPR) repeat protein
MWPREVPVAALPKPRIDDSPLRALFEALHALHHRAGWPSLRYIAKDVGCSHTTVSAVFSEPRLPRWGLLELVVECLGGDTGEFHRLWLTASERTGERAAEPADRQNSEPADRQSAGPADGQSAGPADGQSAGPANGQSAGPANGQSAGPADGPSGERPAGPGDDPAGSAPAPSRAAGSAPDSSRSAGTGPALDPASVPPRQLISDTAGFAGRHGELAQLDALLPDGQGPATGIVAISGTAGIGKTVLAVHWAHRVAGRFTDGQLYINLRGFDPTEPPVAPAHAVQALLDAFAVPPQRIPASFAAQVALYRSILAGRRVLLLLDNARDAEQVRPLLPGAPGCLTVVTSRDRLSGLVAGEGAYPLVLDLMPVAEARELIAHRIGAGRAAAEPAAVDQIVEWCAWLPLALAVVAARAATHPRFGLATVADELRAARGSLDVFDSSDLATDVRAVISWSYLQLSPPAAELFRLLGLHPGPDLGAAAAASLTGAPVGQVRRLLSELARTNLVAEHLPGRYRFHDLLRAYATELAAGDDTGERERAVRRMLDHYLHTAYGGALLLSRTRHAIAIEPAAPGAAAESLGDHARALAWFTAEHPVLISVIGLAEAGGFDRHTWQLAWTLTTFLDRRGLWHDWMAVQHTAVDAAQRLSDPAGQAYAHRGLALAHYRLGDYEQSNVELRQALDLFDACDDRAGQANTHLDMSWVYERGGEYERALRHAHQALDLHRANDHRPGQARALNTVGWMYAKLDDHAAALTYCRAAHELFQGLDDRIGEAATWDSLGYAHHQLGQYDDAVACYRRAVEMFRGAGDRFHEAESLANLGNTFRALTDDGSAHDQWQHALRILDELGHPHAEEVRDRLRLLDRWPAAPWPAGQSGRPRG